jgi:hypothetical protein
VTGSVVRDRWRLAAGVEHFDAHRHFIDMPAVLSICLPQRQRPKVPSLQQHVVPSRIWHTVC